MNRLLFFFFGILLGGVFTGVGAFYFVKREVASVAATTNSYAIHQFVDGLSKDNAKGLSNTQEWLCHTAFRMNYQNNIVWKKTTTNYIQSANMALNKYRNSIGLQACEN